MSYFFIFRIVSLYVDYAQNVKIIHPGIYGDNLLMNMEMEDYNCGSN